MVDVKSIFCFSNFGEYFLHHKKYNHESYRTTDSIPVSGKRPTRNSKLGIHLNVGGFMSAMIIVKFLPPCSCHKPPSRKI